MSPWKLAGESESSQQIALFCFCAKAQHIGFKLALQQSAYESGNTQMLIEADKVTKILFPVPELAYFHHIPNGGSRGDTKRSAQIAGGKLKAEGVKAGVLDCFWPLQRWYYNTVEEHDDTYSGLYIEMKRPSLKSVNNPTAGLSEEQKDFGQFVINNNFSSHVCYTWLEAAEILKWYYELR